MHRQVRISRNLCLDNQHQVQLRQLHFLAGSRQTRLILEQQALLERQLEVRQEQNRFHLERRPHHKRQHHCSEPL